MKTLALLAALLAACSPPPEADTAAPPTPAQVSPPGMPPPGTVNPFTGVKVEEIRQPLTYDTSVVILKDFVMDPNWDGTLDGRFPRSIADHSVYGASWVTHCPDMWYSVWRADDPGIVYGWSKLSVKAVGIGAAGLMPSSAMGGAPMYFGPTACNYEFRKGCTGQACAYIPANHGQLYAAVWPVCPNPADGISGVQVFSPVLFNVPASSQGYTLRMPSGKGPYGWRQPWRDVLHWCHITDDPEWNSGTLHIGWRDSVSGITRDFYTTWN